MDLRHGSHLEVDMNYVPEKFVRYVHFEGKKAYIERSVALNIVKSTKPGTTTHDYMEHITSSKYGTLKEILWKIFELRTQFAEIIGEESYYKLKGNRVLKSPMDTLNFLDVYYFISITIELSCICRQT